MTLGREDSFSRNANLKAHIPQNTGGKPYIHVQVFIKALESCASFIAEWATWQTRRNASHQSISLARSFRTYWLNPLQESILQIVSCDLIEKYQAECDKWREAMPYLFHVLNTCLPRVSAKEKSLVYTTLYTQLGRVPDDSLAFTILLQTWRDALRVLANQVRRAILDGEIDDFYSEFFIEEIERTESERKSRRQLPFQRYRVVMDGLPKFISLPTAENILFAVHAIDCNSIIRDANVGLRNSLSDLEKTAVSAKEIASAFDRMATYPQRSCLILDGASLQWRKNAAVGLSEILPVEEIRSGLATLRAYLLLGYELFWRAFFDELRLHDAIFKDEELTEQEQTRAERILNNILLSVYAEHGSTPIGTYSDAKQDISRSDSALPLVLKITIAGSVVPQYALNETESILLARAAPVYCDIFSIAFSVRRVGCELQKCFQNIMHFSRQSQYSEIKGIESADMLNKRSIHTLCLLRRRMAIVISALEFYVQCAVVQPQYEKLDRILKASATESGKRTPGRVEIPLFDEFAAVQDESVKTMTEQCLLDNEMVVKRYEQIFSSCLSFCASVKSLLDDGHWTIDLCVQNAMESEKIFSRNVTLLAQLLEKTNASCFDSTVCELQRQLEEVAKFAF